MAAQKYEWTVGRVIMAASIGIVVAGGGMAAYPKINAMMDAWAAEQDRRRAANPEGCVVPKGSDTSKAVFCGAIPRGSQPSGSALDTPLGATPSLDDAFR